MNATAKLRDFCAAMAEISWLYALATFATGSLFHHDYPLAESAGGYFLAALLAWFLRGRGFRLITVVFLWLLFLVPALALVGSRFNGWGAQFSEHIDTSGFNSTMAYTEWFSTALTLSWALVFVRAGAGFPARERGHFHLCKDFDLGLFAFFSMGLLGWLGQAWGVDGSDNWGFWYLPPFLVFGLASIACARSLSSLPKPERTPHRLGMPLALGGSLLLLLTGILAFLLPSFGQAAKTAYGLVHRIASPGLTRLGSLVSEYLTTEPLKAQGAHQTKALAVRTASNTWHLLDLVATALAGIALALLAAALAVAVALILWQTFRLLLARTERTRREPEPLLWGNPFTGFGTRFAARLRRLRASFNNPASAKDHFARLTGWGAKSGLIREASLTPTEYAVILGRHFPKAEEDIQLITNLYNRETYGLIPTSAEDLALVRAAFKKLGSPALWPARLRSRFDPRIEILCRKGHHENPS